MYRRHKKREARQRFPCRTVDRGPCRTLDYCPPPPPVRPPAGGVGVVVGVVVGVGVAGGVTVGLPAGASGNESVGVTGVAGTAAAGGAAMPPTTELPKPPELPITARASDPSMNNAPRIVVARVSTVAPARAPKAALAAGTAEGGGDVATLALLQQNDDQQQEAHDDVEGQEDVEQHKRLSIGVMGQWGNWPMRQCLRKEHFEQ